MRDLKESWSDSKAVWLPSIWIGLSMCRPPSLFFNPGAISIAASEQASSSILNRGIYVILAIAGVFALLAREDRKVRKALFGAPAVLVFCGYLALSILWSDVPLYSLRRYMKFCGLLLMVLIVVTEKEQLRAITQAIRRSTYFLVPLSLLFVKYYPELGRGYDRWTGSPQNFGVAYDKNMLGKMCLVIVVVLTASILRRFDTGFLIENRGSFWVDLGLLGLTVYLFTYTNSVTSYISAIVGVAVLLLLRVSHLKRHVGFYLSLAFIVGGATLLSSGIGASMVESFGRDLTLTNRTEIWGELIRFSENPLVGTGYESFWTGARLEAILMRRRINEAHNGYLEIYLNLGLVGLALIGLLLLSAYRRAIALVGRAFPFGQLALALWLTIVTYNFAESGLNGQNITLFLFLMLAIQSVDLLPDGESDFTGPSALRAHR